MKLLPYILFACFVAITITPLAYIHVPAPRLVCEVETTCCMAGEEADCDMEDMECCPPGMCNPAQCAFCCFVCPVSQDKIVIKVYDTGIRANRAANQLLLQGFTSDCWQPPEMV